MDHGPQLALSPLWTHDHGAAWTHQSLGARLLRDLGGHRDSSERERRSSGFSPMAPLGGGAAEMVKRRCSIEATGGAPMGRWFWARGKEIGARVGVMGNVELSMPFIGPLGGGRRTVKGREVAAMELQ
jgi:hypothetical protein